MASQSRLDRKQVRELKLEIVGAIGDFMEGRHVENPEVPAIGALQAAACTVHAMDGDEDQNLEWAIANFRRFVKTLRKP